MDSEMIAALAILVGGFLIFLDRRRKKRQSDD
ncbi:LPXTG cell wall anchor domain-containing protein [Prolixibacter sp. NT017]|nr:LPXTG cell wall anchor domain-containing protein [Prolixibacter sp. NT017]